MGKPKFLLTTRTRLRSKVQPSSRRISFGLSIQFWKSWTMGFSWHMAENGLAVSGFLSPFCACRSAETWGMQNTATLLSSLHKIQNFPLKKKGWEVPNLLLLHVLADFSTSCSLELLSVSLMPWGSPTTLTSWRASLCKQFPSDFLAELCRKKCGIFWLFALFPALLTRENSSCTKISSLHLSFLSLPSPVPKMGWFYNSEFSDGWCATTLPVSSSHIPAC